ICCNYKRFEYLGHECGFSRYSRYTSYIIYKRGLFGMYHDWCKSFSTYPRSYDFLYADHLFSRLKKMCNFQVVVVEIDQIMRPKSMFIIRDTAE
ncbi:hypothetical protein S245_042900, partial [Arachis hypogaea]